MEQVDVRERGSGIYKDPQPGVVCSRALGGVGIRLQVLPGVGDGRWIKQSAFHLGAGAFTLLCVPK